MTYVNMKMLPFSFFRPLMHYTVNNISSHSVSECCFRIDLLQDSTTFILVFFPLVSSSAFSDYVIIIINSTCLQHNSQNQGQGRHAKESQGNEATA